LNCPLTTARQKNRQGAPVIVKPQGGGFMRNILGSGLKVWHLLVFGIVLTFFAGGTVALADSDAINGFWKAGQVRFASASSTTGFNITGSNNPSVKVISVAITVPDGKKADLQTSFSADLHHNVGGTYAYCFGYFGLDGLDPDPAFFPGGGNTNYSYQLLGGVQANEPDALTVSMIGYRKGVSAGNHTVNVYINSAYSGCTILASNLNVVANIR
jgi:hypothetical protein